jgi:hypothetical protein
MQRNKERKKERERDRERERRRRSWRARMTYILIHKQQASVAKVL